MSFAYSSSRRRILSLALLAPVAMSGASRAADNPVFKLAINTQGFDPTELQVPANQKIELHITNTGTVAVEFESHDLRREKVIAPGQTAIVYVGPLRAGTYKFFDDFRPTTRGQLIAR